MPSKVVKAVGVLCEGLSVLKHTLQAAEGFSGQARSLMYVHHTLSLKTQTANKQKSQELNVPNHKEYKNSFLNISQAEGKFKVSKSI